MINKIILQARTDKNEIKFSMFVDHKHEHRLVEALKRCIQMAMMHGIGQVEVCDMDIALDGVHIEKGVMKNYMMERSKQLEETGS
jgi:hypothetical protein